MRILRKLIIAVHTQTSCFDRADEAGAYSVHALAICNTTESIALVLSLYAMQPSLMSLVHCNQPRTGEWGRV